MSNSPVYLINGFYEQVLVEDKRYNNVARASKKITACMYNSKSKDVVSLTLCQGPTWRNTKSQVLLDYSSDLSKSIFQDAAEKKHWIALYQHTKFLINTGKDSAWFSF